MLRGHEIRLVVILSRPFHPTTVSEFPSWIDNRLDQNLDNTPSQKHVVEMMVYSERPFFSARQLQAFVKPEVSEAPVRNRLNEFQEIDIVATETYLNSVTLYYINYRESNWLLSPEGKDAPAAETPHNRLSIGFRTISDTAGFRIVVLAGLLLIAVFSGITDIVVIGLLNDTASPIEYLVPVHSFHGRESLVCGREIRIRFYY